MPPTVPARHCFRPLKVVTSVACTMATEASPLREADGPAGPEGSAPECERHSTHRSSSSGCLASGTQRTLAVSGPCGEPCWRHARKAATFSFSPRKSHSSSAGRPASTYSTKHVAQGGPCATSGRWSLVWPPSCSIVALKVTLEEPCPWWPRACRRLAPSASSRLSALGLSRTAGPTTVNADRPVHDQSLQAAQAAATITKMRRNGLCCMRAATAPTGGTPGAIAGARVKIGRALAAGSL
mmetsp:Transcript_26551/g.84210  ORF Transcript_26551/g.84210 Transcript_26551/m.84210 type:complete len:240 (-) Transcript_26551:59-778(-)